MTPKRRAINLSWFFKFKMKQFHWLLCVAKNRDWSRKIAPLSNLTRASLLRNILFIGFVKLETKQWFSAYQDQACARFSLARLPTEAARK